MAQDVWAQTFKYLADQKVLFEGILLKPAMVTPGADSSVRATPDQVAEYTLKLLRRRVPPSVPGALLPRPPRTTNYENQAHGCTNPEAINGTCPCEIRDNSSACSVSYRVA